MGALTQHIHGKGGVTRPIASKAGLSSPKGNAPLALPVDEHLPPVRTGSEQSLGPSNTTSQQPSGLQPLNHHSSHDGNGNTNAVQPGQPPLFSTEGSYEDEGISSHESTNWEYHGPRSCLSLCSQSGMEWVERRTGIRGFRSSAQKFTNDITRRLKLSSRLSIRRVPDPDGATAWKYTSAYFQHALDAGMGVVQRSTFESQLTAYLDGVTSHVDIAWHALRNAIYYGAAFPSPLTATDLPYNYTPTFAFCDHSTQDMASREALEFEQWSMLIPADMDLDGIDLATAVSE